MKGHDKLDLCLGYYLNLIAMNKLYLNFDIFFQAHIYSNATLTF